MVTSALHLLTRDVTYSRARGIRTRTSSEACYSAKHRWTRELGLRPVAHGAVAADPLNLRTLPACTHPRPGHHGTAWDLVGISRREVEAKYYLNTATPDPMLSSRMVPGAVEPVPTQGGRTRARSWRRGRAGQRMRDAVRGGGGGGQRMMRPGEAEDGFQLEAEIVSFLPSLFPPSFSECPAKGTNLPSRVPGPGGGQHDRGQCGRWPTRPGQGGISASSERINQGSPGTPGRPGAGRVSQAEGTARPAGCRRPLWLSCLCRPA